MKLDASRLLRALSCLAPSAQMNDDCLWIGLVAFPVVLVMAVPDQRSEQERTVWLYFSAHVCPGRRHAAEDPPPPPPARFDLLAAERDHLTDFVGGFQQLAHVETPRSGRYQPRVRSVPTAWDVLDVDRVDAVADP